MDIFNFKNYGKIHIKFTILTILKLFSEIKYIHNAVQPLPPSIFLFSFFCFFEIVSHCVAQAGLELKILLPLAS
jgi:hypothetical protein